MLIITTKEEDLMAQKKPRCIVCAHEHRQKINELLICGYSNRSVAKQFNLSEPTVRRHKKKHLAEKVVRAMVSSLDKSKETEKKVKTLTKVEVIGLNEETGELLMDEFRDMPSVLDDLGSHIKFLYEEAVETMLTAKAKNNHDLKLRALKDARECLLIVKSAAELIMSRNQDDDFDSLVGRILDAVHEYPEARNAIASKLLDE